MSYIHALEQFAMYPDFKKSTRWIDGTLANILEVVEDWEKNGSLRIHWSYRLEVLRTLRHVAEQGWLPLYLRDGARDIATRVRKLKSREVANKNAAKSQGDIPAVGGHLGTPQKHQLRADGAESG